PCGGRPRRAPHLLRAAGDLRHRRSHPRHARRDDRRGVPARGRDAGSGDGGRVRTPARGMIGIGARERPAALGLAALLLLLAAAAPGFYDPAALRDLLLANAPHLIVAAGMTLVILAGHIDVSVGAVFGVAAMIAGV